MNDDKGDQDRRRTNFNPAPGELSSTEIEYRDASLAVILAEPETFAPAYVKKLKAMFEETKHVVTSADLEALGATPVTATLTFEEFFGLVDAGTDDQPDGDAMRRQILTDNGRILTPRKRS